MPPITTSSTTSAGAAISKLPRVDAAIHTAEMSVSVISTPAANDNAAEEDASTIDRTTKRKRADSALSASSKNDCDTGEDANTTVKTECVEKPAAALPDHPAVDQTNEEDAAITAWSLVFETYELVEAILSRVDDVKAVLLAQRVNKTFKYVIGRSMELQQKLFFRAIPPAAKETLDSEGTLYAPETTVKQGQIVLNPLFQYMWQGDAVRIYTRNNEPRFAWRTPHGFVAPSRYIRQPDSRGESWRRMLICQGLKRNEEICVFEEVHLARIEVRVKAGEELRMGKIWDWILKLRGRFEG